MTTTLLPQHNLFSAIKAAVAKTVAQLFNKKLLTLFLLTALFAANVFGRNAAATGYGTNHPAGIATFAAPAHHASNKATAWVAVARPTIQASNLVFTVTSATETTLSWTKGNGQERAVFMAVTSSGSPPILNQVVYPPNPSFGLGQQVSTSGWYCVYNGNGSSVGVSGLTIGTTYRAMVIEYNSGTGGTIPAYAVATGAINPLNLTPTISTNGTPAALTTTAGTASASTSFNVSGIDLTSNITVTAPAGFNISPDNATWTTPASPSYTITPVYGAIASTPVYIRLDAADAANTYTGSVALTGGTATEVDVAIPTSTVSAPSGVTVVSITPVGTSPTNAATVDYTVTFSGALTSPPSTLDFGLTGAATGTINSVTTTDNIHYDVNVTNVSGNGSLELDMLADPEDVSPTVTNAPFTGGAYTINTTAPTVSSITAATPSNTNPTNATNVTYTVTFSEPVTGVDATDFTLTTSGASAAISNVLGSGSTYTVTVWEISGTGTLKLGLNNSGDPITDAAGNALTSGFTGGDVYTIDNTAPGASVSFYSSNANSQQVAAVGDVITLDFVATETINAPVITIAGNSVTAANVSGNEWVASYTMTTGDTEGRVPFTLSFTDLAGNPQAGSYNDATLSFDIEFDKTPPTASISAPSASGVINNGSGSVSYTVTYADANFSSSNLTSAGITFNITGTVSGTFSVTGGGASYTVTMANITGVGTVGITLAGGYAFDNAGNTDAGAGPSATFNVGGGDATLSSLTLSNGTLSPGFSSTTTRYTAAVGNGLASINITPTTNVAGSTLTINGTTAPSGSATAVPLVVGSNTISIVVTATDGSTQQTYSLSVNEANSSNNNLASLKTSAGLAKGATVPTTLTETVVNAVTSITVTPVTADPTATVTVNGVLIPSGGPVPAPILPGHINLSPGDNIITIVVTAQNTTTKTYTLTVTRALSASNKLSNLVVSSGTLSPAFGTATNFLNYVGYGTQLSITPTTVDPAATLTINGVAATSGTPTAVPLAIGNTTVTIVVTAQSGAAKTYMVVVNQARSSNNNLFSLRTSGGLAKGKTVATTLNETVVTAVSSITVTPTLDDTTARVTVNTVAVTSGSPSAGIPLNLGNTTISIVVTAQNQTTKTYMLYVQRGTARPIANPLNDVVSVEKPTQQVQLENDGITVHQGLSPNGDGINDFLQIDHIANYPDNKLSIMNRNGQLIFEAKGYDNATKVFDGHSNKNGQMQLPGTYFYSLDYTVNGIVKHKTGFLVLKY